jgi:hypothetical protein
MERITHGRQTYFLSQKAINTPEDVQLARRDQDRGQIELNAKSLLFRTRDIIKAVIIVSPKTNARTHSRILSPFS